MEWICASEMAPHVSTELHRILKFEWLAYIEAHKKAFSIQNVLADFRVTGIRPLNINHDSRFHQRSQLNCKS